MNFRKYNDCFLLVACIFLYASPIKSQVTKIGVKIGANPVDSAKKNLYALLTVDRESSPRSKQLESSAGQTGNNVKKQAATFVQVSPGLIARARATITINGCNIGKAMGPDFSASLEIESSYRIWCDPLGGHSSIVFNSALDETRFGLTLFCNVKKSTNVLVSFNVMGLRPENAQKNYAISYLSNGTVNSARFMLTGKGSISVYLPAADLPGNGHFWLRLSSPDPGEFEVYDCTVKQID